MWLLKQLQRLFIVVDSFAEASGEVGILAIGSGRYGIFGSEPGQMFGEEEHFLVNNMAHGELGRFAST